MQPKGFVLDWEMTLFLAQNNLARVRDQCAVAVGTALGVVKAPAKRHVRYHMIHINIHCFLLHSSPC